MSARVTASLLAVFLVACGSHEPLLLYNVEVLESGEAKVELVASDLGRESVRFSSFEHESYMGLGEVSAQDAEGKALSVARSGNDDKVASAQVQVGASEVVSLRYTVRPGRPTRQTASKVPVSVNGFVGVDFGLVSGRGLFLVPDVKVHNVTVNVTAPPGWEVQTTWPTDEANDNTFYPFRLTIGLEGLINGLVAVGKIGTVERQVAGATVRVVMYRNWPESKRQRLSDAVFSLYQSTADFVGAPIRNPYTVMFVPQASGGKSIFTTSSGAGQARDMSHETPTRWIRIAEGMINRWLRFRPSRMEVASPHDMWFVDGAAAYGALVVAQESELAEHASSYITSGYREYNRSRLRLHEGGISPGSYYSSSGRGMARIRRQAGLALTHYLDTVVLPPPRGFQRLLARAYEQRTGVDLRELSREVTGFDILDFQESVIYPTTQPIEPLRPPGMHAPGVAPQDLPWTRRETRSTDTLSLVLTGHTQSLLEACGCKANMSGGITRRATLIRQVRDRRPSVLVLDAGNVFPQEKEVPRIDSLTATEVDTYLGALARMDYAAVGIGRNELFYGREFLQHRIKSSSVPFLASNVEIDGAMSHLVTEWGRYKIALVGAVEDYRGLDDYLYEEGAEEFTVLAVVAQVREEISKLPVDVDFIAVVGGLTTQGVQELAEALGDSIDLIITSGHHEPLVDAMDDRGHVTQKSDAVAGFMGEVLVLYANGDVYGLHHFDVTTDGTDFLSVEGAHMQAFEDMQEDQSMKEYLNSYYRRVAESELVDGALEPLFQWDPVHGEGEYVGTSQCQSCHKDQMTQWQKTRHASAYATLLDVHRHQFPKCVQCHVVGLGVEGGFRITDPRRDLANVQCEVCHGPGGAHMAEPSTETIRRGPPEQTCKECHNPDHDSDFVYLRDYEKVKH